MIDVLSALAGTPLPTLLVGAGIFFIFLSLATLKKPIVISIPDKSRRKFGIIGSLIFLTGISIYTLPTVMQVAPATPTPEVESSSVPPTEAILGDAATEPSPPTSDEPSSPASEEPPPTIAPTMPAILFEDDFSSNSNDWVTGVRKYTFSKQERRIENGKLEFETLFMANAYGWINVPGFREKNFYLTVDAEIYQSSPNSNISVIIAFRHSIHDERAYLVTFNNDSTFSLKTMNKDEYDIKHTEKSTAFDLSDRSANQFSIKADEQKFTIYANGLEIYSTFDDSIRSIGEIGLGVAGTQNDSTVVIFDNLIITEVP